MLAVLKYLSYKQHTYKLETHHAEIKTYTGYDTRKIKKTLLALKNADIIISEVPSKLPQNELYIIEGNKVRLEENPFTQLPSTLLLHKIKDGTINDTEFRLLYYFESYINRVTDNNSCYPGHRKIVEDIGSAGSTVRKALKHLQELGIVNVAEGNINHGYYMDNKQVFMKYGNSYTINIDKM